MNVLRLRFQLSRFALLLILALLPTLGHAAPQNTSAAASTTAPAMSIPAGVSADGLPEAVHLVGRPHDGSALVSLAAQLESARPWAHRRPPSRAPAYA